MDENKHPLNPRIRHETTDVNVWAVGKFGIALVIVTVISLGLVFGLFDVLPGARRESLRRRPSSPPSCFRSPSCRQTPVLDLRAIRAEEDKVLNSYGWVDQPKGVVRIPIAQAIDILAKRGLPHTAPAAAPAKEAPKQ